MKKALKILGIAIVAAAVLASCSQGPQDVNAEVSRKQGDQNYKFEDKTFTQVQTSNIYKVVTVTSTDTHVPTKTDVTSTPYYTTTTTVNFADDGTFTVTKTEAYLAGADGDFRTYTATAGTLTTVTSYTYNPGAPGTIDQIISGLAGTTDRVTTYTGNWDSYKEVDSWDDEQTLNYVLHATAQNTTSTNYDDDGTPLTSAGTGFTSTAKDVYKVVNSDTIVVTLDNIVDLTYTFKGTAVVGEDEVDQVSITAAPYFGGTFYEVEE